MPMELVFLMITVYIQGWRSDAVNVPILFHTLSRTGTIGYGNSYSHSHVPEDMSLHLGTRWHLMELSSYQP